MRELKETTLIELLVPVASNLMASRLTQTSDTPNAGVTGKMVDRQ